MFGSMWNFIKRHKKKFIFTGVVVGGFAVLWKYAKKKLQDLQEFDAEECLQHARRQHHFDSNQRTCNMTVMSMLPKLRQSVMELLDSESLTSQLKNKPANKVEIWEELKIYSFSRTILAVYSISILNVFLRVQLNILGGYMYLDTMVNSDGTTRISQATPDVQQRYLSLVQYLLDKGLPDLSQHITELVRTQLADISLKQPMSLADVQRLVSMVRDQMECHHDNGLSGVKVPSTLVDHLLPSDAEEGQACGKTSTDVMFAQLLAETRDMLESSDFQRVLASCLDTGFSQTMDKLAEYFRPSSTEGAVSINLNHLSMPMAKVIPIMNGLVHTILKESPNTFVQELLLKEQVKDFAANVYEAFSQPELSPS